MSEAARIREDRRAELMAAALRLFTEQGVSKTSVSSIVKEIGVAQGTFYWYFKSKQEIINAIVEMIADRNCQRLTELADSDQLNAVEKLVAFRDEIFSGLIGDSELIKSFHHPGNREVHDRLADRLVAKVVPLMARIIEEGVAEGVLEPYDPDKAALFSYGAAQLINERMMTEGGSPADWKTALTDFVFRGLGCEEALIDEARKRIMRKEL